MSIRTAYRSVAGAAALITAASLSLAVPRPAGAATSKLGQCIDDAWASYNSCLVTNAGAEWAMRECDSTFRLDKAGCYATYMFGTFGALFK